MISNLPLVMEVNLSFPAKTVPEFIAYAKANPGKISMASGGTGSTSHIGGELLKLRTGIDMLHVPYRGGAPALTDLLGGQVQVYFSPLPESIETIRAGKVRALAVTTATRSEALPDVPTFAEAGMPEYQYDSWFGIMAPAGTPKAIVKKINEDIAEILKLPDVQERWKTTGALTVVSTPEQFDAIIRSDTERYCKMLKAAGVGAK